MKKDTIQFWSGPKEYMPAEAELGEPVFAFTENTAELFVGRGPGRPLVPMTPDELRALLTNGANQKVMTMVFSGEIQVGPQSYEIRFPFVGKVLSVSAYCRISGESDLQLMIQKCAADADRMRDENWKTVATGAILAGKYVSDTLSPFKVDIPEIVANDYFRANAITAGGHRDITIEILIQL